MKEQTHPSDRAYPMRVPKIYLETTVFNYMFYDQQPDKKADTTKLFEEIKEGRFRPFTSEYVTDEIYKASVGKREDMIGLISEYVVETFSRSKEIEHLAEIYMNEGIIPKKYETDALHIATATVKDMDIIVSWNFRHIVKMKTVIMTESVNIRNGYKKIGIYSPTEVIDNG